MQTISQFDLNIYPSGEISESEYQEIKNKIEKIGHNVVKFCAMYNITNIQFAELITPDLFLTACFYNNNPYIGIYNKRQDILIHECKDILLQPLTEKRTDLFICRIEAFCKNKDKYIHMNNTKLKQMWIQYIIAKEKADDINEIEREL